MYIYSTDCDIPKAYERMIKYFNWYNSFFPITFTPKDKAIEILNSGFCYCYGRDHEFRPILIVQPYIYQTKLKNHSPDDLMRASIFLCEYVKNNLLIPGQIENWNMIVNLKGTSVTSIPAPIRKVISCLSDNFIARLYKSYVLGLNFFLKILFKLICSFLEEITVRKIVVISGKEDKTMRNFIRGDNFEKRFGGDADNLNYCDDNLFPPNMPSSRKFLLDNENSEDLLITKEQYKKRMKQLPQESLSPYILKENEIEKIKEKEKMDEERVLKEKEQNEKDIEDMIKDIDWEIKDEFVNINFQNYFNSIDTYYFNSFTEDLKEFNDNKNKCNWTLNMKSNI